MKNSPRFPLLLVATLLLSGCSRPQQNSATGAAAAAETPPHDHAEHDHTAAGPHHGMLLEMGDGELHAELVHGRDWATIYILDATGTTACPIDQLQITVNVTTRNRGTQFTLKASPEKNDPANCSSRFVSADPQLVDALTSTDCSCRITVLNAGIPFGVIVPQSDEHIHKH